MTIINPNSISGISSITALNSTAAINLFKADGTAANIIAGVTTGTNFKTGSSNLHNVGIEIAGINVLGADTPIGAGATIYNSGDVIVGGAVTATAFSGSGASLTSIPAGQLTGTVADARISTLTASKLSGALPAISGASLTNLPAQATIANNANNRVITGGSGVNLNGEANLTFDGSTLGVAGNIFIGDSNRIYIGASNDAYIYHDTANTHFVNGTGHLLFRQTANSDVVIQSNNLDRFRVYNDGIVAIGQSNKSSTVGAGNLDIQGNATSCIIEMGNPFPTWQGGIVPNFRITSTNSGYSVDFESIWGGDNLLHKHLSFAGGNTDIWDGTYNNRIARFDGNGRLMLNSTSITNTYDYLTVKRPASGFGELNMTVDANTSTNSAANAFIFTKSKSTYWSGYGFQSSHGHVGAIVGMRDSTAMNTSHKIRIEMGGTHINQSEVKTWDFQNDGDLSISDGNLVVASGHGINFSANGNASGMASELLDIYEEGTWTPYIYPMSSSIPVTYSHQSGKYTRIGNVVHFVFKLQVSNITGNRNQGFGINGFPFNNTGSQDQISSEFYGETWSGEIPTTIKWIGNTNRGVCYFYTSSQHYQSSSMLDINVSSSMLMGAGHYFTH